MSKRPKKIKKTKKETKKKPSLKKNHITMRN
jgi:hypothetical protein